MIDALMDAALREVRSVHRLRARVEGEARDGWILADFGDVLLHLFSPDQRDYYRLEDLWSEGRVVLHLQ